MRLVLPILALTAFAAPALAAPDKADDYALPKEMTDPATAEKLSRMSGVLAKAMMNLPVGELEAAAEGREATASEKSKTIGDEIGSPAEREAAMKQMTMTPGQVQGMMKALSSALPAMISAMKGMEGAIDKAASNLPDPTYPKR